MFKDNCLVDNCGTQNNKSKALFSFSGFFKVGASNKNLDDKMESFDTMESNDNLNINDATSLIPNHKKDLYARICTSSSSIDDEDDETLEASDQSNKRKSDHGIPEVINPKAAVSSEELKLINTLSERIHAGLKNAPKPSNKVIRKKSDASSHEAPIDTNKSHGAAEPPFIEEYGKMIGTIGHGAYGVVSVCSRPMKDIDVSPLPTFSKENKLFFAVKHLKPRSNESVEKFSTKITSEFIIGHSLSRPHKKGDKISPNILKVIDLLEVDEKFIEVMEFCPSGDLYSLLTRKYKNGNTLHPLEADCFMKQLLHGIKYMHDRGIAHCDLKPENILFHPNGLLKICDFGLARGIGPNSYNNMFKSNKTPHITNSVATRWYRAPELILSNNSYNGAIDMWAIGCILAEFYHRRPIFMGKDSIHQIYEIIRYLGSPPDYLLKQFGSIRSWNMLNNITANPRNIVIEKNWKECFPFASISGVDLLTKLLNWDPAKRITVKQAIEHPFVSSVRRIDDEPDCPHGSFDFDYELELDSMNKLRQYLIDEVIKFRNSRE